jgi:hypothetical protein
LFGVYTIAPNHHSEAVVLDLVDPAPRLDKLGGAALCPCRSVSILVFLAVEFKKEWAAGGRGGASF